MRALTGALLEGLGGCRMCSIPYARSIFLKMRCCIVRVRQRQNFHAHPRQQRILMILRGALKRPACPQTAASEAFHEKNRMTIEMEHRILIPTQGKRTTTRPRLSALPVLRKRGKEF